MGQKVIQRTLWYETKDGRKELPQEDLHRRTESVVILGEAGMGKSHLLKWLASAPGYSCCTARQLINRHDPRTLLRDARVLVIDALDEVSAQKEGDAVDNILRRLGELGCPQFVLSCRVADWRSATGLEAIREQYEEEPLELHLVPFSDDDAITFLGESIGLETAKAVVAHFNARGLSGMLGNPQTLELIAPVVGTGNLPETRGELLERAIEVLRVEHRDTKAKEQPPRESGLDAAGAVFAALILTGNEAVVRKAAANTEEGELLLADIGRLPGGEAATAMLGTRLFKAEGADRFSYWHRRIGEFLGARWLAKLADTDRKRKRLLSLFHSLGLVPASLRGIHAWLARDPNLAQDVIDADPMGVAEYGDSDNLTIEQARTFLRALEKLAADNPRFREWKPYSMRGIMQPGLIDDLRRLIVTRDTPFGLSLLVLESIKGARIAQQLAHDLRVIALDPHAIFAIRRAASEVLIELDGVEDWASIIRALHQDGDEMSVRLAIELIDDIGYEQFDDELIVGLVMAHIVEGDNQTLGVLLSLEMRLPESRIEGVLDRFVEAAKALGKPHKRPRDPELTDFAYHLIVRRLAAGHVAAERLWFWLEPFEASAGYQHKKQLGALIRDNPTLRQDLQRLVLLELAGDQTPRQRAWRLSKRSESLEPTTAVDVIALLQCLDPANRRDERWREVIQLARHDGEAGAEVRAAARSFAAHRPDLLLWIEKLAGPRVPKWQNRQVKHERKRRAKQATELAQRRKFYIEHIDGMRAGDYGTIVTLAKVYLKMFSDIGNDAAAHERVAQWIGEDICEAAYQGFEAFLRLVPHRPSAKEIADAFAESRRWDAAHIIVAALAERFRKGVGFDDVSDDRLMAGFFQLRQSKIDRHAGIVGLEEALETALDARNIFGEAMRLFHEPQLEARCEHVDGLHSLMRDDVHATLACELASQWLEQLPNIPRGPEIELIERLLRSGRFEELSRIAVGRTNSERDDHRHRWDAVGLIVDFEQTSARLAMSEIDPRLLWHLRDFTVGRYGEAPGPFLRPAQLDWIVATFRPLWPFAARPTGVTGGDENPWDASAYLTQLIHRLGKDHSEEAVAAIKRMRDTPADRYTETILIVAAEQARIRVEAAYVPPTLDVVDAIARDRAPANAVDLQTFMIEELSLVQAKIRSDDVESWRGFYDDKGEPFAEERCRDHLLGLLRQSSEGVTLEPETHVATDKEVDITCSVRTLRLPIEVKGQWHRDLWHGADTQLDRLYTQDWRAEKRGIYLVLWFGEQKKRNKRLKGRGRGRTPPRTPHELSEMLAAESRAARDGRVTVFVLDLMRSLAG